MNESAAGVLGPLTPRGSEAMYTRRRYQKRGTGV
jgi:hypothetical protein